MGHGGRTVPAAGPGQQTEGWSSTRWPAGAGHAIHDAGRVQRLFPLYSSSAIEPAVRHTFSSPSFSFTTPMT